MIIDLTGDDDVEVVAPPVASAAKRVKTENGGAAVKRESFKGKAAAFAPDTDDLMIVERVQPVVRAVQPHGDTDEVMVTGEVGQVRRSLAHTTQGSPSHPARVLHAARAVFPTQNRSLPVPSPSPAPWFSTPSVGVYVQRHARRRLQRSSRTAHGSGPWRKTPSHAKLDPSRR